MQLEEKNKFSGSIVLSKNYDHSITNSNKWSNTADNLQSSSSSENSLSKSIIYIPYETLYKLVMDPFQVPQYNNDHQLTLLQQQENSIEGVIDNSNKNDYDQLLLLLQRLQQNSIVIVDDLKDNDSNEWVTNVKQKEIYGKKYNNMCDKLLNDKHEKINQINIDSDSDSSNSYEYKDSSLSSSFYSNTSNFDNFSETISNDTHTSSIRFVKYDKIIHDDRRENNNNLILEFPNQSYNCNKQKKSKKKCNRKSQEKLTNIKLYNKFCDLGYTNFIKFLNKTQKERQLREIYTPQVIFKPTVKSSNINRSLYFVNRQNNYKEIIRANQIIVTKILNVQTTISHK